ncbi:hypothetical protein [Actinophytocola sp.]|uniref:hypothetical protein n=1 Tax=Actinophytocola sp. TaxID=1872138 RepID=UPI00389AF472
MSINLDDVEQRLAAFEQRYDATAKPFQWKFTRTELHDLLDRINQHEQQHDTTDLPTAARSTPEELPIRPLSQPDFWPSRG